MLAAGIDSHMTEPGSQVAQALAAKKVRNLFLGCWVTIAGFKQTYGKYELCCVRRVAKKINKTHHFPLDPCILVIIHVSCAFGAVLAAP